MAEILLIRRAYKQTHTHTQTKHYISHLMIFVFFGIFTREKI